MPTISIRSIELAKPVFVTSLVFIFVLCGYAAASDMDHSVMNNSKECNISRLKRSAEMIQFILDDIGTNYLKPGGGGISQIRETATNEYEVRLPQEERIDVITYELKMNSACVIAIKKREISAITKGPR